MKFKGGRSGGRQHLLESAVNLLCDQAAGDAIARREHAQEKKDASRDAAASKDHGPTQLHGQLPRPRDVFYRVGDFTKEISGAVRPSRTLHKIFAFVFFAGLLSVVVHTATLMTVEHVPLFSRSLILQWFLGVLCMITLSIIGCCAMQEPEEEDIEVVDRNGFYTNLQANELAIRANVDGTYSLVGRFVSYSNWRQTQGAVQFASPDRLDTKVMCAPNLWTVDRREVYVRNRRLVDRTVQLHVAGTLVSAMAAERFGMLRGKTYEEGRRILQLYADTQNHTQIDLSWNLVGEPTSLAENTVEYCCALRMIEAGDSTRLKGVEARCFQ